jgi:hypothetical protein
MSSIGLADGATSTLTGSCSVEFTMRMTSVDIVAEKSRFWRSGGIVAMICAPAARSHVEHAVGLVEDEHLHVAELGDAAFHEVDQTARCGDEHVDATLQCLICGS